MAASHGITHEIMHHWAVGSDAGGRYSDRICPPKSVKLGFVAIFRNVRRAAGALFLDMYRICGVPESGREYLYDLFLWAVTLVVGVSVREWAKLAPEFGVELENSGVQSQQTGKALKNIIEPGHLRHTFECSSMASPHHTDARLQANRSQLWGWLFFPVSLLPNARPPVSCSGLNGRPGAPYRQAGLLNREAVNHWCSCLFRNIDLRNLPQNLLQNWSVVPMEMDLLNSYQPLPWSSAHRLWLQVPPKNPFPFALIMGASTLRIANAQRSRSFPADLKHPSAFVCS